jgi:hypothetical protein
MNENNMGFIPRQPKVEIENVPLTVKADNEISISSTEKQLEKNPREILEKLIGVFESHHIEFDLIGGVFSIKGSRDLQPLWDTDGRRILSEETYNDGYSPDEMRKEYKIVHYVEFVDANYAVSGSKDKEGNPEKILSVALNTKIGSSGYELYVIDQILQSLNKYNIKDEEIKNLSKSVLEEISEIKKQRETEFYPILNKIQTEILPNLKDKIFWQNIQLYVDLQDTIGKILQVFSPYAGYPGKIEYFSETLQNMILDFVQSYYDKADSRKKLGQLNELVAKLQEQVNQFIEREGKIERKELIENFGMGRYYTCLVVSPSGDLVPPPGQYRCKDNRDNRDWWPELTSDHVAIAHPTKKTHEEIIHIPTNVTPEQVKAIQDFEKKLGLEKGYFGEPYDLDPKTKEFIDQVKQKLNFFIGQLPQNLKPNNNIELKTDFDLSCLCYPESITIVSYGDKVGRSVKLNRPFTEKVGRKEAQVVFEMQTSVGRFRVLAYKCCGEWNANIQLDRSL